MRNAHICRSTLNVRKPTYEKIKARVLETGRFSAFEASDQPKVAALFTRLCRDPELVCTHIEFPWIKVERK